MFFRHGLFGKARPNSRRMDEQYWKRYRIRLKNAKAIEGIAKAGELVVATLDLVAQELCPGMTTEEINTLVHAFTLKHGARPAPLQYNGFPKSVCVSINEVVCHGIPGSETVLDGDIVNVDVTSILGGWYADASRTFCVGQVSEEARKLVRVAKECLALGMAAVRPGATLGDVGYAVQCHAEGHGYSVVRNLVGHGIGHAFHEQPQVMHTGRPGQGIPLVPGMVFTIEPMINQGGHQTTCLSDGWTVVTADGSLSAQFEQTVLVTDTGVRSVTPFDLEA